MIVIAGSIIVLISVLGGFMLAGGHPGALLHVSEVLIIGGSAGGALIIMSPKKVLIDLARKTLRCLRGAPYSKSAYQDLFKALYELFMLGRRNGMIALEEHVGEPVQSSIFKKYPSFIANSAAVAFLCNGLRPLIDGKVKADQLRLLLETEIETLEVEHAQTVGVLMKTADAMPGFGIVAAVLGIVITMGSISGPIEQIGFKVAAALVGTFLGILLSYGFLNPLATNMEFLGEAELDYLRCIATAVASFASGMAPIMAVEVARRKLKSDLAIGGVELENLLKPLQAPRPNPAPAS